MDYTPYINAASAAALTVGLAFVGNFARRGWQEVKESNRYKEMGWVQRKLADIVVDSVAATYVEKVRPWKLDAVASAPVGAVVAPAKLTPAQKGEAEQHAIATIKEAAADAGIAEHLPSDTILRGQVVNAVNAAKRAVLHSGPTTKGG